MQKKIDNNIINFPHKKTKLEKEVEAIILQQKNHLMLKQLRKELVQGVI